MKRCVVTVLSIALLLCACGAKETTWQEQYNLGVKYLSEGSYQEAVIAFTAAIEIAPKQASAYVGRADAYIAIGSEENLEAALKDYYVALELDSLSIDIYRRIAEVYIRQGKDDEAKIFLKDAYSVVSDHKGLDEIVKDLFLQPKEGYPKEERREYNGDYYPGTYEITEFDQFGNEVKRTWYNANGTVKILWLTEYDIFGNRKKTTNFFDWDTGTGEICLYWVCEDNVTTYYGPDGSLWHIKTDDRDGKELSDIYYGSDGEIESSWEYLYNDAGVLEQKITRRGGLGSSIYSVAEYDERGNEIRKIFYEEDGVTISSIVE